MENQRYDVILFDADRTLFDFDRSQLDALREVFQTHGIPATQEMMDLYIRINNHLWGQFDRGEITTEELTRVRFRLFLEEAGDQGQDPAAMNRQYLESLGSHSYLLDGAEALCRELAPYCKQYIVTNGIKVAQVVTNDDVAVKDSLYTIGRRGVAGTVFVHKIAGALAEEGASLEQVQAMAQRVIDNVRTMGAAIAPCTVPAAGTPGFTLGEGEMEVGIGIHGEPGTHREPMRPADEVVDLLLEQILADIDYSGSEVAVMVNGAGATPLMELYIINNHVADVLAERGIRVYRTFVGEYMTSLEMQGFSISLLRLDGEMKRLLDAAADTPAWH